ncbi:MAG: tetratricopeptide repeat protein, partial [Pseudomonadota bacterium]
AVVDVGDVSQAQSERPKEAVSFGGKPLLRFDIPEERLAETEAQIAELEAKPEKTEVDFINLGYLYVNAGQFNGAIELYGRGLEQFPDSFKLLRHRGHRYKNTRQLDKAIIDLERAVELMGDDNSDVIQLRLSGEPFGTYEHWVWYHIGLYHYLNEEFGLAAEAYEKCVVTAANNQTLVGATDWLYNAYMKNDEPGKAEAALDNVPPNIEINPNYSYYQRVLVYKGLNTPDEFLDLEKPGAEWDGREITSGYGMANWYKWNGEPEKAQLIYDNILETPFWSSWAYVVTDREQSKAP